MLWRFSSIGKISILGDVRELNVGNLMSVRERERERLINQELNYQSDSGGKDEA
jgi:hypothetical protein